MKYRAIAEMTGYRFEIFSLTADNDNGAIWSLAVLVSGWLCSQRRRRQRIPTDIKLFRITTEGENFCDPREVSVHIASYQPEEGKESPNEDFKKE